MKKIYKDFVFIYLFASFFADATTFCFLVFCLLMFLFFNSTLIIFWFLLNCAATRLITWSQYCICCLQCNNLKSLHCLNWSWTWKVLIFFCLIFSEELFADFRPQSIKGRITSIKRITCIFFYLFFSLSLSRISKIVFKNFGNCHPQLNIVVAFLVNNKYENILPTPTFANSPCSNCLCHTGNAFHNIC